MYETDNFFMKSSIPSEHRIFPGTNRKLTHSTHKARVRNRNHARTHVLCRSLALSLSIFGRSDQAPRNKHKHTHTQTCAHLLAEKPKQPDRRQTYKRRNVRAREKFNKFISAKRAACAHTCDSHDVCVRLSIKHVIYHGTPACAHL